jgi:hypothetical protein
MLWHQAGFRRYWRWKSRTLGGRLQIETELRALIWRMTVENPLWGAPRIQSSVANYVVERRGPPNQGWRTFLHNYAPDIAATICSLSRPSASNCSLPSSSFG